jgi:hypothetical protein
MFGYYGSKSNVAKYYSEPKLDTIVEPFCGAAWYSLYGDRWKKRVILIDKYDVIIRIWKYLQRVSPEEILAFPRLVWGESTDDYQYPCIEAKWLHGMLITASPSQPKKKASYWKTEIRPNTQNYKLQFIADNLYKIRHWEVLIGEYYCLGDIEATWYIDPPYQFGGQYYRYGNRGFDYGRLAGWSKSRMGQAIVCENTKADWMDFTPLVKNHGSKKNTIEAVWES